ncbi:MULTISPECIES: YceI family protein [Pseudomonadota]|jgi:polyisoprenoid-binding protein YceI|uniref:YceI family protein n=1 Tax=Pseudomonadota TaxID=1224 RepID=UPI000769E43C|nr:MULTISPECIES: YceI family protein [Pseudomonadota]MAF60620.1 polyisoprenoid-binding protein [Blastomonas sp.]|tara:strand:- start:17301 stop:17933 length:633 start_codon:yes stop_codon:yes gene_type:complete
MRKTLAILALAAAVATTPLIGQGMQLPGQKDASRVTAGTYKTDPGHSLIGWEVNHFGFNDYFGIFGDVAGTLTIDPANPNAAKVDVTIPVAKVTTASAGLTSHLLRAGKDGGKPDFFGPAPADARFVSTKVVASGMTAKITGNLTLNGVTKEVVLDAEFTGAGANPFNKKETIGFEAETTIKRSDFGIMYGLPVVSDEVELDISVAFEKQ